MDYRIHCLCDTAVRRENRVLINEVKSEINVDNDVFRHSQNRQQQITDWSGEKKFKWTKINFYQDYYCLDSYFSAFENRFVKSFGHPLNFDV